MGSGQQVQKGKIQISPAGGIADVLSFEIKNHAKNIELGEYAVMPNHVHGILILIGHAPYHTDPVRTGHALSQPEPTNTRTPGQQRFQNQGTNTISSIIGFYKSAVTKSCNRLGLSFAWQTRFHDHIIRNEESFQQISEYIKNNPGNWKDDGFFS